MSFAGDYKIDKMVTMVGDKFEFVDFEEQIAKETDPHEIQQMNMLFNTVHTILEDGTMLSHTPIPKEATQEDIDEAVNSGEVELYGENEILIEKKTLKIEDGNIYYHDESKFLTGDEWVKLNTENEGELNFVTMLYKKI